LLVKVPVAVLDQETFEYLLPLAYQWARNIENFVLQHGTPLPRRQVTDARQVGVKDVAQCERSGGLEQWVRHYLIDRTNCPNFTIGALEEEARRIAREICAAEAAA
jgi:hypothetical protein